MKIRMDKKWRLSLRRIIIILTLPIFIFFACQDYVWCFYLKHCLPLIFSMKKSHVNFKFSGHLIILIYSAQICRKFFILLFKQIWGGKSLASEKKFDHIRFWTTQFLNIRDRKGEYLHSKLNFSVNRKPTKTKRIVCSRESTFGVWNYEFLRVPETSR